MSKQTYDVVDDPGRWDAIVVRTGMGGGTLGLRLAEQGLKVLFLEKGRSEIRPGPPSARTSQDSEARLQEGRWPSDVVFVLNGRRTTSQGVRGCAVGGSTRLYAAVLERLEPHDFSAAPDQSHPSQGWPLHFAEMEVYYRQAEVLFRVSGTPDPPHRTDSEHLLVPPAPTALDQRLFGDFHDAGLHPYRCHLAASQGPSCQTCLGYPCPRQCKSDTKWLCVEPAVQHHGAELRVECEVQRIEVDEARAKAIVYVKGGVQYRVRARIIVLAAGALETPLLMLASANRHHPGGLANSSGQVGRNLMFHAVNWLAVWPSFPAKRGKRSSAGKTIALRDFYTFEGGRGGVLQSVARSAGYGEILLYLNLMFGRSPLSTLPLLRPLLRIAAFLLTIGFGRATIFALMLEDFPHPENRIEREKHGQITVHYRIPGELRRRSTALKRIVSRKLKRNLHIWLNPDVLINEGHACGTCRFGSDARSSVLDVHCKAHELDNLYVVDASFMPTSGGANPALTIAANALRVADVISRRHGPSRPETIAQAPLPGGHA